MTDCSPLTDVILSLFMRDGKTFPVEQAQVHRVRIDWELHSGQWVMLTGQDGVLLGWASYYRVDDDTLAKLHAGEGDQIIFSGEYVDLFNGPHVYVATCVVSPWARRDTARNLYNLILADCPDAESISWNRVKTHADYVIKKSMH